RDVRRLRGAGELFGSDANYRKHSSVELDRTAGCARVAIQQPLPTGVAEHNHWTRAGDAVLIARKAATQLRSDTQSAKVIGGDELHLDSAGAAQPRPFREGAHRPTRRHEVCESAIVIAQI